LQDDNKKYKRASQATDHWTHYGAKKIWLECWVCEAKIHSV